MQPLHNLVNQTARPYTSATGLSGVIVALFVLLNEFGLGLRDSQVSAIVLAVAVVGNYLVAVTGSNALKKVLLDPDIPTVDQVADVRSLRAVASTGATAAPSRYQAREDADPDPAGPVVGGDEKPPPDWP